MGKLQTAQIPLIFPLLSFLWLLPGGQRKSVWDSKSSVELRVLMDGIKLLLEDRSLYKEEVVAPGVSKH